MAPTLFWYLAFVFDLEEPVEVGWELSAYIVDFADRDGFGEQGADDTCMVGGLFDGNSFTLADPVEKLSL